MLHADGKVITPLFKAQARRPAPRPRPPASFSPPASNPTARLHFEGDGNAAWGTKFVLVAARTEQVHGRIILDVEWVPTPGGEARTAIDCFTRLAPHMPGAQGVIYDTALRGVHHQHLLRELGLLPVNRVTAAKASAHRTPTQRTTRREERPPRRQDHHPHQRDDPTRCSSTPPAARSASRELTDTGDHHFVALPRIRTHRNRDKNGTLPLVQRLPTPRRATTSQTITVRLHGNDDDTARKLNRTENLRPIPPGDPDFERLFPRRNDAESINRHLDDTMWLRRAHSIGHARQHLNLLGFALTVNSLALHRHRRRSSRHARRLTARHVGRLGDSARAETTPAHRRHRVSRTTSERATRNPASP